MELTATICNLIYCLCQANIHREIRLDFFYLTQVRSLSWLDTHSVSNSLTKPNQVEGVGGKICNQQLVSGRTFGQKRGWGWQGRPSQTKFAKLLKLRSLLCHQESFLFRLGEEMCVGKIYADDVFKAVA